MKNVMALSMAPFLFSVHRNHHYTCDSMYSILSGKYGATFLRSLWNLIGFHLSWIFKNEGIC